MNWRLIVIGGLAFFVVNWLWSFVSGPLVHNGILLDDYQATAAFWRPELMQQPPDMAALLPRWITTGLIASFIIAGVYGLVRGSFSGSGWVRGAKYGLVITALALTSMLGWSGVFNLPDSIWAWWFVDTLIMYVLSSAALGWAAEKFASTGVAAPAPA